MTYSEKRGELRPVTNDATGALLVDISGGNIEFPNTVTFGGLVDGGDAAQGTTTDAPLAGSVTKESATARTGISLWKRAVNVLIDLLAKLPALGTAGTASADVITVQGVASMTPVKTAPGTTILGTGAGIPIIEDHVITAAPLSMTVPAGTKRITMWASAEGITFAYNATATASDCPVPTTPMTIDILAADAALLHFYGNETSVLGVLFQG